MAFKIQIIEDDQGTATLLSKRLTAVGLDVKVAYDIKSALEQIQQFKPELVLLDFFLPPGNGLEVLSWIRESPHHHTTPVIITTSGIESQEKDKLTSLGISGYWQKPYSISNLFIVIEKILQTTPPGASAKRRVLAIDDDPDILKIIKIGLSANGYEAIVVSDGQSALQAVPIHNPDLIILDLTMPGISGWHFSQMLRKDSKYIKYRNIPIIILSALIEEAGPGTSPSEGDFLMPKPFELNKILAKMKELLENPR